LHAFVTRLLDEQLGPAANSPSTDGTPDAGAPNP
jgi:hypothetical protein